MDVVSKIIEEQVINKMALTIPVDYSSGFVLFVKNTGWIRVGSTIKDSTGTEFIVKEFEFNVSITIDKGGFIGDITLAKPFFLWGTKNQTNNEYSQLSSWSEDKLPLIWLQDGSIIDSKSNRSSVGANINSNIYFLDSYDAIQWLNTDIALNSLRPMNELAEHFKRTLEANFTFFESLGGFSKVENTRFGRETDNGVISKHFGDDLSGIGVRLTANIYSEESCTSITSNIIYPTCASGTIQLKNTIEEEIGVWVVPSGGIISEYVVDSTISFVLGFVTQNVTFPTLSDEIINVTLV